MSEGCVFCDQSWMRAAEIFIETPHCIFVSTRDPDIRARSRGRRHCPSLTGTLRTRRTGAPQARSPGVGPRRELPGQRTHPITQLVRLLDDERKAEADKDRRDPVETLGAPPYPYPPGLPVCWFDDGDGYRHPHPDRVLATMDLHRDRVRVRRSRDRHRHHRRRVEPGWHLELPVLDGHTGDPVQPEGAHLAAARVQSDGIPPALVGDNAIWL